MWNNDETISENIFSQKRSFFHQIPSVKNWSAIRDKNINIFFPGFLDPSDYVLHLLTR